MHEQRYNACGQSDSKGGRLIRSAPALVRFEQAHVRVAPAPGVVHRPRDAGQVVSRPGRGGQLDAQAHVVGRSRSQRGPAGGGALS